MKTKKNKTPKSGETRLGDLTPGKDASGGGIPDGGPPPRQKFATGFPHRLVVEPPPHGQANS